MANFLLKGVYPFRYQSKVVGFDICSAKTHQIHPPKSSWKDPSCKARWGWPAACRNRNSNLPLEGSGGLVVEPTPFAKKICASPSGSFLELENFRKIGEDTSYTMVVDWVSPHVVFEFEKKKTWAFCVFSLWQQTHLPFVVCLHGETVKLMISFACLTFLFFLFFFKSLDSCVFLFEVNIFKNKILQKNEFRPPVQRSSAHTSRT